MPAGARLDRVEGGGSRWTGPTRSRSQRCTVGGWVTIRGRPTTLTELLGVDSVLSLYKRSRELDVTTFTMADTPITSVTSHASLRHPESTFNHGLRARFAFVSRPALARRACGFAARGGPDAAALPPSPGSGAAHGRKRAAYPGPGGALPPLGVAGGRPPRYGWEEGAGLIARLAERRARNPQGLGFEPDLFHKA